MPFFGNSVKVLTEHELFVIPGNAGMEGIATRLETKFIHGMNGIADLAVAQAIDLTVVGSEDYLADGIVDAFHELGLPIFGPTRFASQLEGSKVWAKELMQRVGIPTASWRAYTNLDDARARAEELGFVCVIKADGLAAGKGSFVCQSEKEVDVALESLATMAQRRYRPS